MAESYTVPHNLPKQGTLDLVRSPTGDNIRKQINALADASNTALESVKAAAASDATTKADAAETDAVAASKGYTDQEVAAAKAAVAWDKGVLAADLNTVQSSGRWTVNDTTLANLPVAVAGELRSAWGTSTGVHEYITREDNPRVFFRRYSGGAFSAWGLGDAGVRLTTLEGFNAGTRLTTLEARAALLEGATIIPSTADLNTYTTPGRYRAENSTILNLPGTGVWNIDVIPSTATGVIQVARNWNVAGKTVTRVKQGATTWTAWVTAPTMTDITNGAWNKPTPIAGSTDMDTFTTPGLYLASNSTIVNMPENGVWAVEILPAGGTNVIQIWNSWNVAGKQYTRAKQGSAWTAYVKTPTATDLTANLTAAKTYTDEQIALVSAAPPPEAADIGIHQHEMRLSHLRARVGAPRMGGKAAVTLICDHGTNNFSSIVIPALRAAGLRCTLALNSQMYSTNITFPERENLSSWSMIKGWHDNDGIEIANHTRTHHNATGEAAILQEIRGGREELEANLSGVYIDTFVQIGTPTAEYDPAVGAYDGFKDGLSLDRYWLTFAGRAILDSHALVTGQVPHGGTPARVYPLDGHPVQGASGYWLDAGQTAIDTAKVKIDEAVAVGGGVILRLHPYLIDWTNQISTQQLTDFFTYLAGRVTAGELEVLPYREWALAVEW